MMGTALAAAVGCLRPEYVQSWLESAQLRVLNYEFADADTCTLADERVRQLETRLTTWSYRSTDGLRLDWLVGCREDEEAARRLLDALGSQRSPEPEELFKLLMYHALFAPLLDAGYPENAVFSHHGLLADEDNGLCAATLAAHDDHIQRNPTTQATVIVAPPIRVKVGRNDPCPCRSGRKAKRCCYA